MNRFARFLNTLRRSFDNQSWIKDWLRGKDYGVDSLAGVKVSPESAIRNSTFFACCKLLSETIAALPLIIYKRLPDNGRERAVDHSLYNVLHLQPNKVMSSFVFREMMMWHLLLWGNSYSNILRNTYGDVVALWPLLPWRMDPKWENGDIVYYYKLPDNTTTIIPNEDVLHIPGMSFDGLVGKSVLSCAREAIGLSTALEEFGARYFGQGTQLGATIEHPYKIGDKTLKQLKAALKQKYQGISNAHRMLILEEGMQYKQNVIPPNDSQFLESRKFQTVELARFLGIPLHLIQEIDRATFNNIEELGISFVRYSLVPWLTRTEQAETIKLLGETDKKIYFIEHLVEGLLRGDIKTRYEAYNIARNGGWMSADDIRAKENMNPLPDNQGKIYWQPLNMMDAKMAAEIPIPKEIPDELASRKEIRTKRSAALKGKLANSHRKLFADITTRITKFEKENILKKVKSIYGKRKVSAKKFEEYLNSFYKEKYSGIDKLTKPVVNTYGKVIFDVVSDEVGGVEADGLDKFLDEYTEAFNLRYIATSKNRLNDTVQTAIDKEQDIYAAVESKFEEFGETRPQTVSLKETIKIAGAISILAYGLAGISKSVWVAAGSEPCDFCLAMSGRTMSIGESYQGKDDIMKVKGKEPLSFSNKITHPPLHGGCECQIMPV